MFDRSDPLFNPFNSTDPSITDRECLQYLYRRLRALEFEVRCVKKMQDSQEERRKGKQDDLRSQLEHLLLPLLNRVSRLEKATTETYINSLYSFLPEDTN